MKVFNLAALRASAEGPMTDGRCDNLFSGVKVTITIPQVRAFTTERTRGIPWRA
ncbi:MAG: hypothetical protein R6V21_10755 [Pelovirga sp.]